MPMSKTQLNRVEHRLCGIINAKVKALRKKHQSLEPSIDDAIAEASKRPKKFVEIATDLYRRKHYADIVEALRKMPSYKAAEDAAEKAGLTCEAKVFSYQAALEEEKERIMDSLYLRESAEALKLIADFQKFEPKV